MAMMGKGAIAAMGLAVAALAVMPTASADPSYPFSGTMGDHSAEAYRVDVSPYLGAGSIAAAGSLANLICGKLESGVSEGQLIASVASPPHPLLPVDSATFLIHAAEWHFCPERRQGLPGQPAGSAGRCRDCR